MSDTFRKTFEIEFNGNDVEVEASFEIYADDASGSDPNDKNTVPALDSDTVVIELVKVGAIPVQVASIIPKNLEIIKEAIIEQIEYGKYLENLVQELDGF